MPPRTIRLLALALVLPGTARAGIEQLAEVQRAGTPAEALLVADQLAGEPWAAALGIDYLRGSLLEALGKEPEAAFAFAQATQRAPLLAPYCRYRLARLQAQRHPEMTAGLLVPLLARDAPPVLRHQAAVLLRRALRAGGDCRLLARLDWPTLAAADRRTLAVARVDCALAGKPGEPPGREQVSQLAALLTDGPADQTSWEAALRLAALQRSQLTPDLSLLLGRVFQRLRQPDLASAFLGPLVSSLPQQLRDQQQVEAFELLALSQVARDAYRTAVVTLAGLAERVGRPELRARALYREGWARELAGDRSGALNGYVRAVNLAPSSDIAAPALLATCRVQWLLGRRAEAQSTYGLLRSRREWSAAAADAALFLATSQLAAGEVGNAPSLLQQATQLRGQRDAIVVYWQGRADEAQGHPAAALDDYLWLLRALPYHPLTAEARSRLAGPALQPTVKAAVERWRRAPRADDRLAAWLLLDDDDARREPLRLFLYQLWARDRRTAPYLKLAAVDPREWPLWQASFADAEERVLALGGWDEVGLDTILRNFPLTAPPLAFTAAEQLTAAADPGRGLALAGDVAAPPLRAVPPQLLPLPLRQALFPRPWRGRVGAAARRFGVDAALLWALMREGSRFDPEAVAAGGGRGLLLLDPGSAERVAPLAGTGPVRPDDLDDPALAIILGAARLNQLATAFPGRPALVLAAHLAGPAEARLWASWCATDDPAELLAKMDSEEVRTMVGRVLGSQMAYADLAREP
ncbi:MAG TPA: transglycosylase SLT domain-containing protein [Thermoanaerobaculia bacterium]|nr:transglycosylase SLT domain-containing protein [Thermoanaerobaculia bacterium]